MGERGMSLGEEGGAARRRSSGAPNVGSCQPPRPARNTPARLIFPPPPAPPPPDQLTPLGSRTAGGRTASPPGGRTVVGMSRPAGWRLQRMPEQPGDQREAPPTATARDPPLPPPLPIKRNQFPPTCWIYSARLNSLKSRKVASRKNETLLFSDLRSGFCRREKGFPAPASNGETSFQLMSQNCLFIHL